MRSCRPPLQRAVPHQRPSAHENQNTPNAENVNEFNSKEVSMQTTTHIPDGIDEITKRITNHIPDLRRCALCRTDPGWRPLHRIEVQLLERVARSHRSGRARAYRLNNLLARGYSLWEICHQIEAEIAERTHLDPHYHRLENCEHGRSSMEWFVLHTLENFVFRWFILNGPRLFAEGNHEILLVVMRERTEHKSLWRALVSYERALRARQAVRRS
jgi:hypothetical protein